MKGKCKTSLDLKGQGWGSFLDWTGKVIQYTEIDTNGGQSGSPIVIEEYGWLIGIHTGGTAHGKNWGIEFHDEHLLWIVDSMGLDKSDHKIYHFKTSGAYILGNI